MAQGCDAIKEYKMTAGRLLLRATVGGLMAGHGLQKLTGSFGGPGLEGTAASMEKMGLHPARQQAMAVALSETIGGGLTVVGLANPLGPAMITGVMAVAIRKVHGPNGVWVTKGGYEYNLTIMAAAFAIAADGPGHLSIDALRGKHRGGPGWSVLQLAVGLGTAAVVMVLADKLASGGEQPAEATVGTSEVFGEDGEEPPVQLRRV